MFRGYRWQLFALILAIGLFLGGIAFRLNRQVSHVKPAPTPTAQQSFAATAAPVDSSPPQATAVHALATEAPPSTQAEAPYREGLVGAVRRLNPLFAHLNPVDRDISSLIFEGLFAANEYGEIIPQLAEELVISADGIEYVVKLRADVRWQDGRPFTADDVVYTMTLLSDPAYTNLSPTGAFWSTVETRKLGDRLLRFRLAQPFSGFTQLLTIGILPEHALRGTALDELAQHPFNLSPIGTGPYQLAELRLGGPGHISAVELARSPIYMERPEAQGKYELSRLSFSLFSHAEAAISAYRSGALNALSNIGPRAGLLTLPGGQVYTQFDSAVVMIIFNWKRSPFAERRLRQALSLSLDVPALVANHIGADVTYADSPYTPGSSVYRPHPFWTTYDIDQAGALLEAAGILPSDPAETPAEAEAAEADAFNTFSLLIEDSPDLRSLAQAIAEQWLRLGFQVQIDAVGAAELANRLSTGRFEAAVVNLPIGGDFDLYRYWHPAQYDNGRNYGAAADDEVAELIEKARREIYSDRRAALHQQLQNAFAEQAIAVPLYYPLYTFVVSEAIEGVQLGYLASPADRFRKIADWRPASRSS